MLTAKRLRELLIYNPDTGEFFSRVNSGKRKSGERVGTINNRGYVVILVDRKVYLSHRLAWLYMTGSFPSMNIDHKDRCPSNNKWENLREVNQSQNLMNAAGWPRLSSGARGVWFMETANKWTAYITKDRKRRHLGCFEKYDDAVAARRAAEHGETVS